ncbi:hypothetical protein SARC_08529 [Sphaeroforma arctica JP610]|uniref:Uncharacterized protein n=1 Tax=Sphaeroforma arctica JP610 TaxID=667725 RepID=A0A0L0FQL6_9EUKA|nr:hypothetical protein SARC_08529 [Sphaeroforma arctica JP610]KNC79062.1 hypothetical protein SARC_08529 [Sphaeroforma arctica JP610]|eukprot:XP_014152964.1 hypothetical protein SARC_08529 [Sphaeroforma arctica JP610]
MAANESTQRSLGIAAKTEHKPLKDNILLQQRNLFATSMENLGIKNSGTSVFPNVSCSRQYANVRYYDVPYQTAESRHARLKMSSDEESVIESTRTHLEDLLTAVGHTAPSANINNASMQIPLTRTDLCTGEFRQNKNLSVNGDRSAFRNRVLIETLLRDLCAEPVLKPEQAQSENFWNVICGPDENKHTNICQAVAEANKNRRRLVTSTSEDIFSSSGEIVRSQASTYHSRSKAGSNHNEANSCLKRGNTIPAHKMLLENGSTREANNMQSRNNRSANLTNLEFYDSLVEMYKTNQTTQGWQP